MIFFQNTYIYIISTVVVVVVIVDLEINAALSDRWKEAVRAPEGRATFLLALGSSDSLENKDVVNQSRADFSYIYLPDFE